MNDDKQDVTPGTVHDGQPSTAADEQVTLTWQMLLEELDSHTRTLEQNYEFLTDRLGGALLRAKRQGDGSAVDAVQGEIVAMAGPAEKALKNTRYFRRVLGELLEEYCGGEVEQRERVIRDAQGASGEGQAAIASLPSPLADPIEEAGPEPTPFLPEVEPAASRAEGDGADRQPDDTGGEAVAIDERACSREGCDRPPYARGLCKTHYNATLESAKRRTRKTEGGVAPPKDVAQRCASPATERKQPSHRRSTRCCSVEGCGQPVRARGLCVTHYNEHRKELMENGAWDPSPVALTRRS